MKTLFTLCSMLFMTTGMLNGTELMELEISTGLNVEDTKRFIKHGADIGLGYYVSLGLNYKINDLIIVQAEGSYRYNEIIWNNSTDLYWSTRIKAIEKATVGYNVIFRACDFLESGLGIHYVMPVRSKGVLNDYFGVSIINNLVVMRNDYCNFSIQSRFLLGEFNDLSYGFSLNKEF